MRWIRRCPRSERAYSAGNRGRITSCGALQARGFWNTLRKEPHTRVRGLVEPHAGCGEVARALSSQTETTDESGVVASQWMGRSLRRLRDARAHGLWARRSRASRGLRAPDRRRWRQGDVRRQGVFTGGDARELRRRLLVRRQRVLARRVAAFLSARLPHALRQR